MAMNVTLLPFRFFEIDWNVELLVMTGNDSDVESLWESSHAIIAHFTDIFFT